MRKPQHLHRWLVLAVVLALVTAGSAIAATVTISASVTKAAEPGGTATAKVVASDNSVVQSSTWTQTGGLPVTILGATGDTASFVLPDRTIYKKQLFQTLEEAPVPAAKLPSWIPAPTAFSGGLQERFDIVGVSPHARIDTASAKFDVTAVTATGTYKTSASVQLADLPWQAAIGQRNVPIKLPVLVHAPTQASYNWALTVPTGSKATIVDGATQNAEFTPDIPGTYSVTITNLKTNTATQIKIAAGTWKGIITGQDANGRPTTDPSCSNCHVGKAAVFTTWANSGHAEIFTQNVSAAGHYSQSCLECHSVGFSEKPLGNNGITDQTDWAGLAASGLIEHGAAVNWTQILSKFPNSARMANIQCENCHGPQTSEGHGSTGMRQSLSSDMCGSCHGEPARHGRFQQWQLSAHADYEVAQSEGTDPTCGKCHSGQGFLQWQNNNFSNANLVVDWTVDTVHPQTCATCHDPHDVGTTSGLNTNAKVRVMNTTPALLAGFSATNAGSGAICMTCHNGRRGLRDEQHFDRTDLSRAPHEGPQADILMGQNLYFAKVGTRGFHGTVQDTCVNCHMEKTSIPPSTGIALAPTAGGGTNHTFYADPGICSSCHTSAITADAVQGQITSKMTSLKSQVESAILAAMRTQIRAGNAIDLGGQKTVKSASQISAVEFISSHGRQGVNVKLADGTAVSALALNSVKVVRPSGSSVELYVASDPNIAKAGWNYLMVSADKSKGVHNPAFVNSALDISLFATQQAIANGGVTTGSGTGGASAIGGGPGNGAGAIACKSAYVYWAEIAGHAPGVGGSQWRTDLVTRNLSSTAANLQLVLHQAAGNLQSTGTVLAGGQNTFEDVVATLGGTNNTGSLEICSDQPLLVMGRIYNAAQSGTFGQNIDGTVADIGYTAGQTVSLIGLRQKTDLYRSNLSVTNSGTTDAQVSINLYDAAGNALKTYTLSVPAGLVVQDTEPFKNRAGAPDVDWGFATVTVVSGNNIHTSASLIDMKTNDPTTIAPKQ